MIIADFFLFDKREWFLCNQDAVHDQLAELGRQQAEIRRKARHADDQIGEEIRVLVGSQDLLRVDDIDVEQRAVLIEQRQNIIADLVHGLLAARHAGIALDQENRPVPHISSKRV